MKIAICAQAENTQTTVDPRFGRAAYFAVFDDAANQWDFIPNSQNLQTAQGAGTQSAQIVIDAEADVLLASNVGPKAMAALKANGVEVFKVDAAATLEQALIDYTGEKLIPMQQANVEGHWV